MQTDLFGQPLWQIMLGPGAMLLQGFAVQEAEALVAEIDVIAATAPFRYQDTPGGRRMSVAMTNCGALGWVSDRQGYRYSRTDPLCQRPWPAMPTAFLAVSRRAASAAGFGLIDPQACLVNRCNAGARLALHQDRDEAELTAPIVSVSLGLSATFLWGGLRRADPARRIEVRHGDVVVWGGPSRLSFHGVAPLRDGLHPLTGACRGGFNRWLQRLRRTSQLGSGTSRFF